jgi:hypothetical protein
MTVKLQEIKILSLYDPPAKADTVKLSLAAAVKPAIPTLQPAMRASADNGEPDRRSLNWNELSGGRLSLTELEAVCHWAQAHLD